MKSIIKISKRINFVVTCVYKNVYIKYLFDTTCVIDTINLTGKHREYIPFKCES